MKMYANIWNIDFFFQTTIKGAYKSGRVSAGKGKNCEYEIFKKNPVVDENYGMFVRHL